MDLRVETPERSSRVPLGERRFNKQAGGGQMDEDAVKDAYRRWAPVYDHTFGRVAAEGRQQAVEYINTTRGRVLEVGVGTGLSLPGYKSTLEIVGIDLSPEMLEKARERVDELGLNNVSDILEMDASSLDFPDAHFDTTVAMYVMTVVPDPVKVMQELARVTKPGGQVILVNHFSQTEGVRGWVERRMAPFAELLGWHPVFDLDRVMVCDDLDLVDQRSLRPLGIFTMLRFAKAADARAIAAE